MPPTAVGVAARVRIVGASDRTADARAVHPRLVDVGGWDTACQQGAAKAISPTGQVRSGRALVGSTRRSARRLGGLRWWS